MKPFLDLMDEAGECGKGANAVVSWLYYFFENHCLGEKHMWINPFIDLKELKNSVPNHNRTYTEVYGTPPHRPEVNIEAQFSQCLASESVSVQANVSSPWKQLARPNKV